MKQTNKRCPGAGNAGGDVHWSHWSDVAGAHFRLSYLHLVEQVRFQSVVPGLTWHPVNGEGHIRATDHRDILGVCISDSERGHHLNCSSVGEVSNRFRLLEMMGFDYCGLSLQSPFLFLKVLL